MALLLPSHYPEVALYPNVRELLRVQVDIQFVDLATLLRLPVDDLDGGCNLTATTLGCNIIAGASTLFFEASVDAVRNKKSAANQLSSGERFRRVCRHYLPEMYDSNVSRIDAVQLLYKRTRNPLAHALGVGKATSSFPGLTGDTVMLSKAPLPAHWVEQTLAGDEPRPVFLGPLVSRHGSEYTFDVNTLAWSVCRMLRTLLADRAQMVVAEATAILLRRSSSGEASAGAQS